MGQQGEKKEMIQKAENAKENFTGFPDILRVALCPFQLCDLDGTSSQKAETKLRICYEQYLTQSS